MRRRPALHVGHRLVAAQLAPPDGWCFMGLQMTTRNVTNPPWRPGWFRSPTAATAAGRSGSRRPAAVRGAGAARVPDRGRGDRGRLAGRVSSFPAFSGGGPTAPDPRRGGRRRHPRLPARQPRRGRLRRRRGERHGGGAAGDRAAPAVAGRARPRPRGRQRPGAARPGARGGRLRLAHRPRAAGGRPERPGRGRRPGALVRARGRRSSTASRSCTPSCWPGCGRCCGEPRDGAPAGSCASATSPWTRPRARCGWRVAASSWRRRSSRCCTRWRRTRRACIASRSCCGTSGATCRRATRARSTPTPAGCARSCIRRGGRGS